MVKNYFVVAVYPPLKRAVLLFGAAAVALPALGSNCHTILQLARSQEMELGDDHPVTKVLRAFEKKITSGDAHHRWIDQTLVIANLDKINAKINGRLAAYPYDGDIKFYYQEAGKIFYLTKRMERHEPEELILSSEKPDRHAPRYDDMIKRFSRDYPGLGVVGYERAYDGNIVPILAPSNRLTEYRDMSGYSGDLFSDPSSHQALARETMEVPLIPIRAKIRSTIDLPHNLPRELRDLLKSQMTLTTAASVRGLSQKNIVSRRVPAFTGWSAFMIGSHDGQGRTGVLQKDGIPILVERDGQEYFIELKGVGLASAAPRADLIHHRRQAGYIRLGRMDVEQVDREMAANAHFDRSYFAQNYAPQPIIGVQLPEFAKIEAIHGVDPFHKSRPKAQDFTGQVYRLADTTRRMAYADNPAYGPRYTQKADLLHKAQYAYGKLYAELRFENPARPLEHHSPHPQNFTVSPNGQELGITDLSDIHPVSQKDLARATAPALTDVEQYSVFKNLAGQKRFLLGVKSVLERKGLWTARLEALFQQRTSGEKFRAILREEVIIPLHLKTQGLSSLIPAPPISGNFHLMNVLNGNEDALLNQGLYLEIAVRHSMQNIKNHINKLASLGKSTPIRDSLKNDLKSISQAASQLTKVLKDLGVFHQAQNEQAWTADAPEVARLLFASLQQQAAIADGLSGITEKSASYFSNRLKKSDLAIWLRQNR